MMKTYVIFEHVHEGDVFMDIEVAEYFGSEADADRFAKHIRSNMKLFPDYVELNLFGKKIKINNREKSKYGVELCQKETIPVSSDKIRILSNQEISDKLFGESYRIGSEHMVKVDWDFKTTYNHLKKQYPHKDSFSLSSLAYSIRLKTDGVKT